MNKPDNSVDNESKTLDNSNTYGFSIPESGLCSPYLRQPIRSLQEALSQLGRSLDPDPTPSPTPQHESTEHHEGLLRGVYKPVAETNDQPPIITPLRHNKEHKQSKARAKAVNE